MNDSLKQAMMAALPSPDRVGASAPGTQAQQNTQDTNGSPMALGMEAMTSKRQGQNGDEIAEKQKKLDGLRPLN